MLGRPQIDSTDFSVAILAGGQSRRMGRNKAFANLAGRSVISYVIEDLGQLSDDLFIVGGHAASFRQCGLPHVADQYPTRASIVGVYSAVAAARHNYCLVVPCDMPFAPAALARSMASVAGGYDVVVPVTGSWEPLFALYSKNCLEILGEQIELNELALKSALSRLNTLKVEPGENFQGDFEVVFMNLNTEEDLKKAERILSENELVSRGPSQESRLLAARPVMPTRPPLTCFVGKKNSGKTTFLEKLVALLVSQGLKVAFIKHDAHGFEMDRKGTDTWRIARAGACEITISSPRALAMIKQVDREPDLEELYAGVGPEVDFVVAEGFKASATDKIEISRSERSTALVCREEELIAVISDRPDAAKAVPVFGLEDAQAVAQFLIERYVLTTKPKVRS